LVAALLALLRLLSGGLGWVHSLPASPASVSRAGTPPDYYATAAQIIPVLLIALVFQVRFTAFFTPTWMERDLQEAKEEAGEIRIVMTDRAEKLGSMERQLASIRRKLGRTSGDGFRPYWVRYARLSIGGLDSQIREARRVHADQLQRLEKVEAFIVRRRQSIQRWDRGVRYCLFFVLWSAFVGEVVALSLLGAGKSFASLYYVINTVIVILLSLIVSALTVSLLRPDALKRPKNLPRPSGRGGP